MPARMSVSGISGAIAGGLRGELRAGLLQQAFRDAGIASEATERGFEQAKELGRSVTRAGLEAAKAEMLGTLIDVVA